MTLDPAPAIAQARLAILAADQAPTAGRVADELGISRRSLHRWHTGHPIGPGQADRTACRLGLHPVNLWPHYYDRSTP